MAASLRRRGRFAAVAACMLVGLGYGDDALAQKKFGVLLGGEGIVSFPLSDRTRGGVENDSIDIGGRLGIQAGALYRKFALVARTRVGATTAFGSPPDITFDLYATYTLPLPHLDLWLGGGYSALFPSAQRKLAGSPHSYHGAAVVIGNRWTKGFYSEYGLGIYPHKEGEIDELLFDLTVSVGYRHIFRF